MIDYEAFWYFFLVTFGVTPIVIGGLVGTLWAAGQGWPRRRIAASAAIGAMVLGTVVFGGAVLYFRA